MCVNKYQSLLYRTQSGHIDCTLILHLITPDTTVYHNPTMEATNTIWEGLPRYPVPDELEKALASENTHIEANTALLNAALAADREAFTNAADELSEPKIHTLVPVMKTMTILLSGVRKEVNHDTRVDCHILGKDLLRRVMGWQPSKEREVVLHYALTVAALTGNVDIALPILAEDHVVAFHEFPIYAAVKAAAAAVPERKDNAEVVLARLVSSLCEREHNEDVAYVASLLLLDIVAASGLGAAHVEAHKASIITEALEINRQLGGNAEVAAILMPAYRRFVGERVEVDSVSLSDVFVEKAVQVYSRWSITQCRILLDHWIFAIGNGVPSILRSSVKRRIRAGVGLPTEDDADSEVALGEYETDK
ncbi:hypothetical protein ASPVEDRAFT_591724 [Aspergillus versicolor CBS 583.65]|uniref:Uncharacterized protein n=1 Tax=Aspergillus versicolor CBS 583.65 TaxID=1036611 RepID=A0A1L9PH61_ASPVE|nr:uncharacterized protein ASPVEDRAFT_591724 [Aspergillus versicolor CBS 583.65]OJJ00851.1 hypothetical protein ASPVEDRAFT_591724 [Aspergillus versicolor CBS 583.65]